MRHGFDLRSIHTILTTRTKLFKYPKHNLNLDNDEKMSMERDVL